MQKTHVLITLLFMVTVHFSFGQQHIVDSLKIVLGKLDSDTAKIVVLNEIAMKLNLSEPKASNKYAMQALEISEANYYFVHIIDTYATLAVSNNEMEYYNTALEYLHKKMDVFIEQENYEMIAETNFQIATIHCKRNEKDLALKYLSKITDYISEIENSLLVAEVYCMIGNIYLKNGNHKKTEQYWIKSSEIYEKENDIYGINYIRNSYAKLYEETGQYKKAIIKYEKVLEYCTNNNDNNCICPVLNHIGDVYRKQKLFDKAREHYLQSLEIALQQEMKNSEMASYKNLYKLDSLQTNYVSAFHNLLKYNIIKDNLFTKDKEKNISELNIKYDSQQKTRDIKSLQEEKKRKNKMIIVIIVIIILLLLALVFHWQMLRIRRKSHVQLENNNKIINKQKDKIGKIADELLNTNQEIKTVNKQLNNKNIELINSLENIKRIQKQLIQTEKMASIGVLTAGIAHEINNPVNFIQSGVNSLIRDFKDIEKVIIEGGKINLEENNLKEKLLNLKKLKDKYAFDEALKYIPEILEDIKLGAERTTEIVKSLSSFTRSDDDRFQFVNIHEGIETALVLLRNKYKNNIEIIKSFDVNIPNIRCKPSKTNQIFMNLLSNAIDAISGKGKIYIKTKLLDNKINISIKDTGHGINKELQTKVFDPFYTSKSVGKGMGMGLYIVYGLVQEHNGSIDVISESGKGSEFIISLPLK